MRIAGIKWKRPALDPARLRADDEKRAERLLGRCEVSRIALATRSALIEACALPQGAIAQVPLIELQCGSAEARALLYSQLLAPPASAWYIRNFAAMDQTGAGVDLRVQALKSLPIVPPDAWPEELRLRVIRQVAELETPTPERLIAVQRSVLSLYDGDCDGALRWWWSRTPRHFAQPTEQISAQ